MNNDVQTPMQTLFNSLMLGEKYLGSSAELEKGWKMLQLLARHGGSLKGVGGQKESLPIRELVHTANVTFLNRLMEVFPELGSQLCSSMKGQHDTPLELIRARLNELRLPSYGDTRDGKCYENELSRLRSLESRIRKLEDEMAKNTLAEADETTVGRLTGTVSVKKSVAVYNTMAEALANK